MSNVYTIIFCESLDALKEFFINLGSKGVKRSAMIWTTKKISYTSANWKLSKFVHYIHIYFNTWTAFFERHYRIAKYFQINLNEEFNWIIEEPITLLGTRFYTYTPKRTGKSSLHLELVTIIDGLEWSSVKIAITAEKGPKPNQPAIKLFFSLALFRNLLPYNYGQ